VSSGPFRASVQEAWKLAQSLDIAGAFNSKAAYPTAAIARFRQMSYLDEWKACRESGYWDIQLKDRSLLQFRDDGGGDLSFSYFEVPLVCQTYEEWTEEMLGDADGAGEFLDDYDTYFWTCGLKPHVTPMRYDYTPGMYRTGAHPAAHLHVGRDAEIRLGARRIFKPISFFMLVVRQYYPATWEKRFLPGPYSEVQARAVRESLELVPNEFWKTLTCLANFGPPEA
jgi:hypothetical protein